MINAINTRIKERTAYNACVLNECGKKWKKSDWFQKVVATWLGSDAWIYIICFVLIISHAFIAVQTFGNVPPTHAQVRLSFRDSNRLMSVDQLNLRQRG